MAGPKKFIVTWMERHRAFVDASGEQDAIDKVMDSDALQAHSYDETTDVWASEA